MLSESHESEGDEPSQFLVESLRMSTRSLRFLFLFILGLSILVGYSIFQQPWWIIERVSWGINTFEQFELLHRDFRNEPALDSATIKIFEKLKTKAKSLADVFDKLNSERPNDSVRLENKIKSSLTEEQIDYLEDLFEESSWDDVASLLTHIRTTDTEKLSVEYLSIFASYLYPGFWEELLDGTVTLLKVFDEYSADLSTEFKEQGIVTATLGVSWDMDLDKWNLGPQAVIRDADLRVKWDDRLYNLPSLKQFSRSTAVLLFYCEQYNIDPCSLSRIRHKHGKKSDENVLRNLEVPYLGKSMGNLQIVLAFPFILFTLVLLLYLQFRRRKMMYKTMAEKRLYHDMMLLDAPTIFANIEMFSGADLDREERTASIGLRLMVVLALIYALGVVVACVFYIAQEVYFDVILVQIASEIMTITNALGFSVSLPFLEFPWLELISVIIWIFGAVASVITGAWVTWLIWKELHFNISKPPNSAGDS